MQKAIPANVGYKGFPKTLCTSVNHVICHGIPSPSKVLKDGDIVNIDVTVIKDGWHGDTSRMYFVGQPPVLAKRLVDTTFEAMMRGIGEVRPGATLGDIGHAIQKYVESNGYSVVREYCGHGIGQIYHEDPQVLHYGQPGAGMKLHEGHDLHGRADGQRRQAAHAPAAGRLDRGDQGSFAVGAVGAHDRGHRRRLRDPDALAASGLRRPGMARVDSAPRLPEAPRLPPAMPRSGVSAEARLALRQLLGDNERELADAFRARRRCDAL